MEAQEGVKPIYCDEEEDDIFDDSEPPRRPKPLTEEKDTVE